MKNNYKAWSLSMLATLLFMACSKNESKDSNEGKSYIDISIAGYINPTVVETTEFNEAPQDPNARISKSASINGIFDQVVLQENKTEEIYIGGKSANTGATATPVLTQLDPQTRYVVMAFDDDNKLVGAPVLSIVGEKTRIEIPSKFRENVVNYKIVAFSYNRKESSDYTAFINSALNDNPTINIPNDREFMYSSTIVPMDFRLTNPLAGGYQGSIQLQFNHQSAKVGVVLDAMVSNAKVLSGRGFLTSDDLANQIRLNTGTINLRTGVISNIASVDLNGSFDLSTTNTNGVDSLAFHMYTVVNTTSPMINKFKVNFSSISVKRSDGVTASLADKAYNFNTIAGLERGKKVNARMYLFEGFTINGEVVGNDLVNPTKTILWSLSNLWYDASATGTARYKFRAEPYMYKGDANMITDYWVADRSSLFSTPTGTGAGVKSGVDPCSLKHPINTWRLPTAEEARVLIDNRYEGQGITKELNVTEDNKRYTAYTKAASANSATLYIYSNGYYNLTYDIAPKISALLWTSKVTANIRSALFMSTPKAGENADADAIVQYEGALATPKMNIRCVRDAR